MDNPPYLFDQFAKTCGLSKSMAKRAIMLKGYAADGQTLKHAAGMLGISRDSAMRLARKFVIDFDDYRPFSAVEKRGGERPDPYIRDVALPVSGLPLFEARA